MNAATNVCTNCEIPKTIKTKILKGSLHVFISQIKAADKIQWIKGELWPEEFSVKADKKTNTIEALHLLKDKCHHIPGGRGFNARSFCYLTPWTILQTIYI